MNSFSLLHPVTSAVYFISVLIFTMFSGNPFLQLIAFVGGFLFYIVIPRKNLFKELLAYLLIFVVVALSNPLFTHKGVTPLFFINGNPVTKEALLYGVNLAFMLVSVVFWFGCFNFIMTGDKLLFLTGKISPKISILLSSALRFIPTFRKQAEKIRQSQKAMGLYASDAWSDKIKGELRVYSALITLALENAIDTGASMKARGYGLKGRSHYSHYKFRRIDTFFLIVIFILDGFIVLAAALGKLEFNFYPSVSKIILNKFNATAIIAFTLLCLLPIIFYIKEGLEWKYLESKI